MKKLMVIRVGGHPFGLDLIYIRGVYRTEDPASFEVGADHPLSSRLKSRKVVLLDLSRALGAGGPIGNDAPFRRLLLMEVQGLAVALGVDQIEGVIQIEPDQIVPLPPVFTGKPRRWFPGVFMGEDDLIPLVNPTAVALDGAAAANLERRFHTAVRENRVAEHMLQGIRKGLSVAMERKIDLLKNSIGKAGSGKTG